MSNVRSPKLSIKAPSTQIWIILNTFVCVFICLFVCLFFLHESAFCLHETSESAQQNLNFFKTLSRGVQRTVHANAWIRVDGAQL